MFIAEIRVVVYNTCVDLFFFFFKQKTAYEMCGRDWSSDVCSSDLAENRRVGNTDYST